MVPYYASCGAYKMLPDEAPLLYVLRQHCHVAVKIISWLQIISRNHSYISFLIKCNLQFYLQRKGMTSMGKGSKLSLILQQSMISSWKPSKILGFRNPWLPNQNHLGLYPKMSHLGHKKLGFYHPENDFCLRT